MQPSPTPEFCALLLAALSGLALCDASQRNGKIEQDDYSSIESPEKRLELPLYKVIPAAGEGELTPANGWPPLHYYEEWERSLGDPTSSRYSAYDQINRENVHKLEVAWSFSSGDARGPRGLNIQANPIVVNGFFYGPTVGNALVALDAATGKEIWRFQPTEKIGGAEGEATAQRGLVYWEGNSDQPSRLLFLAGRYLYCLNPRTGKLLDSFGDGGMAETGIVATAGAIYKNIIVLPSKSEAAIFGHDIFTGERLWRFNTSPQEGDLHYDPTVEPQIGARGWGGIALDESRGLVYFGLGNARFKQGLTGPINESLYANCVLALEAETGNYAWHFQEIRHDIWDLDIPAPPILVTVERHGKRVDAVATLTKMGNTLLLDRVSGKPLFDFRLRRAPTAGIPGVRTWPYQPDLELPEPFAEQEFKLEHVTDRTPEAREHVMKIVEESHYGWFEPFQKTGQRVIFYGIHGGAEWTGGCFDPETGTLFVSSNEIPWYWAADDYREIATGLYDEGRDAYMKHCAACHGPDRTGLGVSPSLVGLSERYTDRIAVREIIKKGKNTMLPVQNITNREMWRAIEYLYSEGEAPKTGGNRRIVQTGMGKLQDHEGFPGIKPPWGNLVAINLNTGRIKWKVPLGEHPDMPASAQPTGTENFGGPSVSAGGLVFCAGTRDHLIRAFDSETGEELWRHQLPFGGYAPPSIYKVDGKQYVVIAATSGGKLGGELGDAYVAFALPEN